MMKEQKAPSDKKPDPWDKEGRQPRAEARIWKGAGESMAEFCLDCWNRIHGTRFAPRDVKTDLDLCEGCGQQKPVVVAWSGRGLAGRLEGAWRRLEYLAWSRKR